MNPMKMMKQVQKMQADMAKMQEELAQQTYEAEAAGGTIKAVANGEGELKSLTISPDLIKDAADDPEMLQDLVVTAVREAVNKGKMDAQEKMGKLTSGLNLPPGLI
ncbi:MAG: YbaB/EbfC family nucleoid-associated protein [Verrucomicrobiota bacterium]